MNQKSKNKRAIIEDLLWALGDALDAKEERDIVQELKPKLCYLIAENKNKLPKWLKDSLLCYNNTVSQERYKITYEIKDDKVVFTNRVNEEDLWPL